MKIKHTILFILSIALFACNKNEASSHHTGDYEWTYTQTSPSQFLVSQESEDKYGIRITKKRVQYFKNGERIENFQYVRTGFDDIFNDYYIEYISNVGKTYRLSYDPSNTDLIELHGFPFQVNQNTVYGAANHFKKK